MMSVRFIFLAILLMGSAALARADGLPADPRMIVSDPVCIEGCLGVGLTFSFQSDANGGGFFTFQNVSDFDWSSLLIETGSVPFNVSANLVTCQTNAFLNCQVSDLAGGITAMYLSGVNPIEIEQGFVGIRNGDIFTIELNDIPGTDGGGWGSARNFDAAANVPAPVPEPATLILTGTGIAALVAKNKLRGRRPARG